MADRVRTLPAVTDVPARLLTLEPDARKVSMMIIIIIIITIIIIKYK